MTSNRQTSPSPEQLELMRKHAEAERVRRVRAGEWQGGVAAHLPYQKRPVEWIERYLGIPREQILWSVSPEYRDHPWDGTKDPLAVIAQSLAAGHDVGCESGTGTGKAQPVDEPVLTPDGWRPIGELAPGDKVIDRYGSPTDVLAVYPQGRREVFRLTFSDGAETRACREHLWVMQNKKDVNKGCPWRLLTTGDLLAMSPKTLAQRSLRVPLPTAVVYGPSKHFLPLDPYVLGVLLGDGGFTGPTPMLSSADAEIVEAVRAEVGVDVKYRSQYDYALCNDNNGGKPNPLTEILRRLDLWGCRSEEKWVPARYMYASPQSRLAVLQGLLDTDGSVSARGKHIEFCSTSPTLAANVVELVRSVGGTARCRQSASYLDGERKRDRYRVAVNMPGGMAPFRLPRKAEIVADWGERSYGLAKRILRSVEPAGEAECVCIRVAAADSLYVTNDFIVTHNTFWAACLVYWFLACFEDSIIPTVAPKEDQLLKNLWKELGRLWPRFNRHFPMAEMLTSTIRMKPTQKDRETWACWAFVCGVGADETVATKAQGMHAQHMLVITEETPGIHPSIMIALRETRTDDHNLQLSLGNPDHRMDELHKFCEDETTTFVRISALDHPNVVTKRPIVPGAIGRQMLVKRTKKLGLGSRLYNSRIRGISPPESETALIKHEWCVVAAEKWKDPKYREGPAWLGVDVADVPTGDNAALARGIGRCCTEVSAFPVEDANLLGKQVATEIRATGLDPKYVGVDTVGVGAGTKNELKRLGIKVRHIFGNAKAVPGLDVDTLWSRTEDDLEGIMRPTGPTVIEAERFDNLRSQMFWRCREDLRTLNLALPDDEELFTELCAHEWTTKNGKIAVLPKDEVIVRLGHSPNKADALVMGNWVRGRSLRQDAAEEDVPDIKPDANRDWKLERLLQRMGQDQKRQRKAIIRQFKRYGLR